ncbi:hypothetical protein GCM10020220_038510 [Nonomuraea rubra]
MTTPGGRSISSSSRAADSGERSDGLSTTVFPAASRGPSAPRVMGTGKFHGTMTAVTPSGLRTIVVLPPSGPAIVSSNG